jgi:hypothetical protein
MLWWDEWVWMVGGGRLWSVLALFGLRAICDDSSRDTSNTGYRSTVYSKHCCPNYINGLFEVKANGKYETLQFAGE